MVANNYIPKRRLNNAHRLQTEKHLLEKHYDFLDVKITGGVLFATGFCTPSAHSITYEYKLRYNPSKYPSVFAVNPIIAYHEDIHMYSDDKSLCLHFPKDYSWTRTSQLFNTIIPWTHEWFLFYELFLITGKWQHPFVDHRKLLNHGI